MRGDPNSQDGETLIKKKADKYYAEFLQREYTPRSCMVITILTAVYSAGAAYKLSKANQLPFLCVAVISLVMMAVVICLLLIWMYKPTCARISEETNRSKWNTQLLQSLCAPLMALALGAGVLLELHGKACTEVPVTPFLVSGLKTFPFFILFTLRDTNHASILAGLAICLSTMFAISMYSQAETRYTDLLAFGSSVMVFLYDFLRQTRSVRRLIAEFHQTLAENEKLAVEAQALELRAMIGNVAHDLKTPLTSFLSGIECMSEVVTAWSQVVNAAVHSAEECTTKSREVIAVLQKCLKNMQGTNSFMTMTINRCIDYTKASKGVKLVPKLETAELQAQLEMPVDLMRSVQSSVEVKLTPLSAEICSHIITDQQWLIENLLCLLSNAVKYSHKGTVEVGVSLERAPQDAQFLRLEVQDTGVGLSKEAMQTLFNPFKQAQRLAGGTGLGLFSLARRVESLQGRYGVRARADGAQGSVFWFTIPYRPDALSARMSAAPRFKPTFSQEKIDEASASSTQLSGEGDVERVHTVLVVDDAPMIVKMTTMLLKRKGHTVESAVNGADALEKLLRGYESARSGEPTDEHGSVITTPYDVVLMDLQMPVLDGVEAVRRLRVAEAKLVGFNATQADNARRNTPRQIVIALSANSDEETRLAALEAGADAFMAKPFTYENFAKLLHEKEGRINAPAVLQ